MKLQTKKNFDDQPMESKTTRGGKASTSPKAISKLVADVILLENQFDDDYVQ